MNNLTPIELKEIRERCEEIREKVKTEWCLPLAVSIYEFYDSTFLALLSHIDQLQAERDAAEAEVERLNIRIIKECPLCRPQEK